MSSSHGAVSVPLPSVFCWFLGKCEFLHDTAMYYIVPHMDITLRWGPEDDDTVFLIFAITFGCPRDYTTDEPIISDEIGFWHRGRGMKLHWDPLVPSLMGICYPHITPAFKEDPFEIRFVNRTSKTVYMDVSVWYFEYSRETYKEFMDFINGFINFFRMFAKPEEARRFFTGVVGRG